MVQKSFGRRSPAREAAVAAAPAPHSGSTSGRSVAILAGVTALVVVTALGLTLAFTAVANTASDIETTAQADVVVQDTLMDEARCRGQSGCTSQYDVKLSCGSSEEPRSISVHAADAEAAQAKAERYNRDCRARGASFVAVFMRSGAGSGVRVPPAAAAATRVADNGSGGRRSRLRFRRR